MKKLFFLIFLILSFGIKITFAQDGCWEKKKNMSVARGVMPAVMLNDSIYVIGGSLDAYRSTSVVEVYDTATDSWTPKANLPQKLCGETAGSVNNKIYVIGGSSSILGSGYVVDSVYEYNPVSNSWARKSNIPTPLAYAVAAVMVGKIYVIGGCPFGFNSAYKSVYEYNPATDTWTRKSDMPTARFLASATAVEGKIYVFGGMATLTGRGFSNVEVYDPSADTWAVKGSMPVPRTTQSSSAVNGNIYIFSGGKMMGSVYNDVLKYNPTLNTWETMTPIITPRVGNAACPLGGKIYVFGGMDISNNRLSTVEEYDPVLDATNFVSVTNNNSTIPRIFRLGQNYPNPFNPTTNIQYSIASRQFVELKIFNVLGQEIQTLVNAEKPAGNYQVEFNAANLPSGIYLYRIQAGSFNQVRKMILIK